MKPSDLREWLSWWSTTLPRSGPRVRVPSRARETLYFIGFFYYSKQIVSNIVSNTERGCPDGVLKVEKAERSYFFAFFKADMTLIIMAIYDSIDYRKY